MCLAFELHGDACSNDLDDDDLKSTDEALLKEMIEAGKCAVCDHWLEHKRRAVISRSEYRFDADTLHDDNDAKLQKLMTQSPENGRKPHFGPNFDHFWPI